MYVTEKNDGQQYNEFLERQKYTLKEKNNALESRI